jgi:hypothetical protein
MKNKIFSGYYNTGHVQGIAIDEKRGFIYYSFTTLFVKCDLLGNFIGSVTNLIGHLGCIALSKSDGKVFGSLEFKHDSIGRGISERLGISLPKEDGFYIVCFDTDKIVRADMDAEKDCVMLSMHLKRVTDDFLSVDESSEKPHRYGCSGIDGITLAPSLDGSTDEKMLTVAYGIYSDTERCDNDYQVILQYSLSDFELYKKPLLQSSLHRSGPDNAKAYFFYTGNTVFGIQNLEYDEDSSMLFAAVYKGKKEEFTPFSLFTIDISRGAPIKELVGRNGEAGKVLKCAELGKTGKKGIRGSHFPYGSTGMASLGGGRFAFSKDGKNENGFYTYIEEYTLSENNPDIFIKAIKE